jgi:hypothetical protein
MTEEQMKKLSDEDLQHVANNQLDKMSDAGLEVLAQGPGRAPEPAPGQDTSGSLAKSFNDMEKGFASGALNEGSFNYVPPNYFPNNSPVATDLGRVVGGLVSGAYVGKAVSKIPGLAKLLYGADPYKEAAAPFMQKAARAGGRVAFNSGLAGAMGLAQNPRPGETRGENALNNALFGGALSTTAEVVPELSRYLGRKIGGLNAQEAEAFRANPEKAKALYKMMSEGGADRVDETMQTMFRGAREPGVVPGGGLQDRLQANVIDPAKAAKSAALANATGTVGIDASQTMGLSPDVAQSLPSLNMASPKTIILTPTQAAQAQTAAASSAYARERAARSNPIAYPYDPGKDADLALANDLRSKVEGVAPEVNAQNKIMEAAINRKDKVNGLGANLSTLLTSDGQNESLRSYYDRNTGSRLNRMANQLEAGKKLYGDRQMSLMNIPSLLSLVGGQPLSRGMIRTPVLPKNATGMSALQAIIRGTRGAVPPSDEQ